MHAFVSVLLSWASSRAIVADHHIALLTAVYKLRGLDNEAPCILLNMRMIHSSHRCHIQRQVYS